MNKKIILISLISLSVFMAGCKNKQITVVSSNNKQSSTNISQPKNDITIIKNQVNKTITPDNACNIVSKLVGTLPNGYHLEYDHMQSVNNKEYYVIHLYEVLVDNGETGDSHTVTYEWYYADIVAGTVYKLDIPSNTLTKVDEESIMPVKQQQVDYKQYANARFGFSM